MNEIHEVGTGSFFKRIILAVKVVESVTNRMSYIILRGRWCDIIILNGHAPAADKIDHMAASTRYYNVHSKNSLNTIRTFC
jgi:hypothetical protein